MAGLIFPPQTHCEHLYRCRRKAKGVLEETGSCEYWHLGRKKLPTLLPAVPGGTAQHVWGGHTNVRMLCVEQKIHLSCKQRDLSSVTRMCACACAHTHTHSRTSPGQNSEDSHAGKQGEVAWMTE